MRQFALAIVLVAGFSWAVVAATQENATKDAATQISEASAAARQIGDFSLADYRGKSWSLSDFQDAKLVVVAFLGTECPLANIYSPRLAELDQKYSSRGVAFLAVNSNQQDSLAELAHHARVHKLDFPVLKDPGNVVADQFAAERTPEVFVLDSDHMVRYRGRIDDQYTYGKQRPQATREDLATALDELLSGKPVSVPQTEVDGCHIGRVLKSQEQSEVTYSQQISRIFQRRCVECHRPGEIAPFSLTSYDEAVGWAEMIEEVVSEQRMPPWNANPDHGTFINDARLTAEEKQLIHQWVHDGAPEGDPSDLPPPAEFVEGWRIGQPDQVLYMSEKPYSVPAKGEVKYQYFVVDPGFTEDKWIQAAECRPDNRLVVHHIIVAVKPPSGDANADLHGLSSQWLAATAPGARPLILPEGMAKFVPAGSKLVFQMHYTPNGSPQEDRSSVGLIFADPAKVHKQVATQQASSRFFRIPPHADNYEVTATYRFSQDSLMLAMFPHMHLRGKSFRYTAKYPDGTEEVLLDVPHYDFNWQNSYEFAEPKLMPAKTVLECVAHFDNSAYNLANPDPSVAVTWGDQTWEEMMIGYFDMALADQDLAKDNDQTASQSPATQAEPSEKELPASEIRLDPKLAQQARQARTSAAAWQQFADELQGVVPQLDRVCWTTVEAGSLHVRLAAQESFIPAGPSGLTFPAQKLALAKYAAGNKTVVNPNLAAVKTPDFRLMSRMLASSVHVPVNAGGVRGTVNFWSSQGDAFPAETVRLLTDIGHIVAE